MLGQVSGIYVDSRDHIWVTNRPRTLDENDRYAQVNKADCCLPAPPVLEFDMAGNLIQGWGGPGQGYEWPDNEHGMFVDYKDNVWIGGSGMNDTNILKFTRTGKYLLQIGHHGKTGGSNDTENLNRPAGIVVYPKTNEVFVADGYGNRRVIVFDADTGAYKRRWGAYGNKPDDGAPRTRSFEGRARRSSTPCTASEYRTTTLCMWRPDQQPDPGIHDRREIPTGELYRAEDVIGGGNGLRYRFLAGQTAAPSLCARRQQ